MYLNAISCQFTEISTHSSRHYKLDNHILEQVEENPFLGVTIHQNIKWACHKNKIYNKPNSVFCFRLRWMFIQRNLKHATHDLKELAYISLVTAILEYSSTDWDPFYQKDIDRLERVQRRAARFVFYNYNPISSVTSMVSQLVWRPLAERKREHRLFLLY